MLKGLDEVMLKKEEIKKQVENSLEIVERGYIEAREFREKLKHYFLNTFNEDEIKCITGIIYLEPKHEEEYNSREKIEEEIETFSLRKNKNDAIDHMLTKSSRLEEYFTVGFKILDEVCKSNRY